MCGCKKFGVCAVQAGTNGCPAPHTQGDITVCGNRGLKHFGFHFHWVNLIQYLISIQYLIGISSPELITCEKMIRTK